jgi:hypothetical protein
MNKKVRVTWTDTTFYTDPKQFPSRKVTMSREMYEKLTNLKTKVEDAEPTVPDLRRRLEDINVDLQRIIKLANSVQEPTAKQNPPTTTREDKKQTKSKPEKKKKADQNPKKAERKYTEWFKQFKNNSRGLLKFREEKDERLLLYFLGKTQQPQMLGFVDLENSDRTTDVIVVWGKVKGFPENADEEETFPSYEFGRRYYVPARTEGDTYEYWNQGNREWEKINAT